MNNFVKKIRGVQIFILGIDGIDLYNDYQTFSVKKCSNILLNLDLSIVVWM